MSTKNTTNDEKIKISLNKFLIKYFKSPYWSEHMLAQLKAIVSYSSMEVWKKNPEQDYPNYFSNLTNKCYNVDEWGDDYVILKPASMKDLKDTKISEPIRFLSVISQFPEEVRVLAISILKREASEELLGGNII